ncbi:unnamed protein product [Ectocarpus sp. CCAP 1310/34]|nr:unnamed protein product [Ectocarpus sp. CCAP 1310/34]
MSATGSGPAIVQRVRREGAGHQRVPTPGVMMGGLSQGSDKGPGTLKVVPAGETKEGVLCIEMRIRLYTDGAMSKLLESLAKVKLLTEVVRDVNMLGDCESLASILPSTRTPSVTPAESDFRVRLFLGRAP